MPPPKLVPMFPNAPVPVPMVEVLPKRPVPVPRPPGLLAVFPKRDPEPAPKFRPPPKAPVEVVVFSPKGGAVDLNVLPNSDPPVLVFVPKPPKVGAVEAGVCPNGLCIVPKVFAGLAPNRL